MLAQPFPPELENLGFSKSTLFCRNGRSCFDHLPDFSGVAAPLFRANQRVRINPNLCRNDNLRGMGTRSMAKGRSYGGGMA